MIKIITTVESIDQARQLLDAGVDELYFGQDEFGLRLPNSFNREDQEKLTKMAHDAGKTVSIAVNAILHNEDIEKLPEYLKFLKEIEVDSITVGDPGAIHIMRKKDLFIPFRYDAQVMTTNSRQINFWKDRGAIEAVAARELPKDELAQLAKNSKLPIEMLVYGATCIQQSRRPLLQNYFNYIKRYDSYGKERGFFISDPNDSSTHYSVYQDINGTHTFANNDINMSMHLLDLVKMGIFTWKFDGIFTPEKEFVEIVKLFIKAKEEILNRQWNEDKAKVLNESVKMLHPQNRGMDTGFYLIDPSTIR